MAAMEKRPAWLQEVATPAYVIDEKQLIHNLEILKEVQDRSGCSILLAQKAFSMYACYPLIAKYLKGAAASQGCFQQLLKGHTAIFRRTCSRKYRWVHNIQINGKINRLPLQSFLHPER